jgi:4-carboxymuconolactone decarboxylase
VDATGHGHPRFRGEESGGTKKSRSGGPNGASTGQEVGGMAFTPLNGVAPKLVDLTEDVLSGDVWGRPQLSERDRSLITCAALVATGKTEQMEFHFPNAIKNGVTQEELVETITHLAFYVGWPNAMSALNKAKAIFEKKEGAEGRAV